MNRPLADHFYEAMEAEMETLTKIDPWEVVPREEAGNSNVLDSTWVFKTTIYKARICVQGYQQQHKYNFLIRTHPL